MDARPPEGIVTFLLTDVEGSTLRLSRAGLLRVDSLLPRFYEPRYRDVRYT